ncbi:hypothetical protein FACS189440_18030 [Bacteroidia bacterium]|nr:hypothetical protein FACS189440_18030 [Bacteroidia bacterium]
MFLIKNDKAEILKLVRRVVPRGVHFAVFPSPIANKAETRYIGFDLDEHKENMNELKKSNLFSSEFINNIDKAVLSADKNIRDGEEWMVGDLGYFDDYDPWCNCQDRPDDNKIEITFLNIDSQKATLTWTWEDPNWSKDNPSKVRVVKENGIWKIAYLQGFDFGDFTENTDVSATFTKQQLAGTYYTVTTDQTENVFTSTEWYSAYTADGGYATERTISYTLLDNSALKLKYKFELAGTYDILEDAIVFNYIMATFKLTPIFTDTATALEKETPASFLDILSGTMKKGFLKNEPVKILELNADKLMLSNRVTFKRVK